MQTLATLFRTAQFFAHNAHNLAKGQTFYEDHEVLGELYPAYESAYDTIVERLIGSGEKPDLAKILTDAADMANEIGAPASNSASFMVLLTLEKKIQAEIAKLCDAGDLSYGTENMLQGLADESEVRAYKLGQRVK